MKTILDDLDWALELDVALTLLDECGDIDCDVLSHAISHVLCRANIRHQICYGYATYLKDSSLVTPHFWLELDNGFIIDYRLQKWLGDCDVPHGVFNPSHQHRITYSAISASNGYEYSTEMLGLMTNGRIHDVKLPQSMW